jgi:hypothetical protein
MPRDLVARRKQKRAQPLDFPRVFRRSDLVTLFSFSWNIPDDSCATPVRGAHCPTHGSSRGSRVFRAKAFDSPLCRLCGIRVWNNISDAAGCDGREGRKPRNTSICAFAFVSPLTANLRRSMDQFLKKTINEEGKKKEGEENFARNSLEEDTGDGTTFSARKF